MVRSTVYAGQPTRPGDGSSQSWRARIGDHWYLFTVVNMPSGEIRWIVKKYDMPVSKFHEWLGGDHESRMRFDCYWHAHRQWTFKVTK